MKQNRRDYALAAVALTLAAGMLTATIFAAQPRTEDQPDAFELRRGLIDRIEAAYTNGDTATMERMNLCAALPEIPDPDAALTAIAGILGTDVPNAGPTGVAQEITTCTCPTGTFERDGHCFHPLIDEQGNIYAYAHLGPADCQPRKPTPWPGGPASKDPAELPSQVPQEKDDGNPIPIPEPRRPMPSVCATLTEDADQCWKAAKTPAQVAHCQNLEDAVAIACANENG